MRPKSRPVGAVLALLLFTLFSTLTRAASVMAVHGSQFLVQGTEILNESGGWAFTQRPTFSGETRFWTFILTRTDESGNYAGSWGVAFGAPHDEVRLSPGLYLGVTSDVAPVAWGPSLSLSGNGQGATTNQGQFEVLELIWTPDFSKVESAAIDFLWGRENSPTAIRGSLRYDSEVPLSPVPEPSAALFLVLAAGMLQRRRK